MRRALFYCYLTFLDHRTNISRKVRTPRLVRVSRAPNKFKNCHLDKTNMDKTSQHLKFSLLMAVGRAATRRDGTRTGPTLCSPGCAGRRCVNLYSSKLSPVLGAVIFLGGERCTSLRQIHKFREQIMHTSL